MSNPITYAQRDDITKRYGDECLDLVADRDSDQVLDEAAIKQTLEDATDHINASLAARYPLPLTSVPPLLTRLCIDIALYWLGDDRGGASEERRTRFEDAEKILEQLASGERQLALPVHESLRFSDFCSAPKRFSRSMLDAAGQPHADVNP